MPAEQPPFDPVQQARYLVSFGMYEGEQLADLIRLYHQNHGTQRTLAFNNLVELVGQHPPKPRIEPGNRS